MLSSAAICLWKSFRRSRTQFRDRPETVRLHRGTGVHLHPGILFGINPERRSESSRNRVHLAPDSPPLVGKSSEPVLPVTYTLPWTSTAMPLPRPDRPEIAECSPGSRGRGAGCALRPIRIPIRTQFFGVVEQNEASQHRAADENGQLNFVAAQNDCGTAVEVRGFRKEQDGESKNREKPD